jgi:Mrp family chromosome partitioning ATPase/uncharacterized protein involved in exopolysaccharide biosynthesis
VSPTSLSQSVERAVDSEGEISLREFFTKVYVRPRLFWTCVLLPPILAVLLTAVVPKQWQATAKILIRYSSSESPFLQGLIPGDRPALSGASSAEILKSIPALAEAVKREDIQPGDIYRKPSEVLRGYISALGEMIIPSGPGPSLPGIDPKTLATASAFKKSLESSSTFGSTGKARNGVEVLQKSSQLPEAMQGDELIEVTVPSFSRGKVAPMTNGLAQAFIDEYYKVSAEDAHRVYVFLSALVDSAQAELADSTQPSGAGTVATPTGASGAPQVGGGSQLIYRESPLLESIAKQLADRKANLERLRQIYSEDSPQVKQAREQVDALQRTLGGTQRVEVDRLMLEELKARRYQAYNAEQLYRHRLIPISVIEPALTPKNSVAAYILRYLLSGSAGLLLGLVLGTALVVILSSLDQRLFASWDVQRTLHLPLLGWLPQRAASAGLPESGGNMDNGLLQILGHLDAGDASGGGRVVAITSSSRGEGKSYLALRLVMALARGGRSRVLLIDADPTDRSLTRHFRKENQPGLTEAILDGRALAEATAPSGVTGIDLVPAGNPAKRGELGFYRRTLKAQIDAARAAYDLVVVDTSALLDSNEALICCMAADATLLVIEFGSTRRPVIRQACQKLGEVGVSPQGVILNRRRYLVPDWIYRHI